MGTDFTQFKRFGGQGGLKAGPQQDSDTVSDATPRTNAGPGWRGAIRFFATGGFFGGMVVGAVVDAINHAQYASAYLVTYALLGLVLTPLVGSGLILCARRWNAGQI